LPTIKHSLSHVSQINKEFTGTVALRNEKICLPDGSKVAIGIDGDRWVIVYQSAPKAPFFMYEYNATKQSILVDKKPGTKEDLERARNIINYFFENAVVEDIVTIEVEKV
jgi:hypothetical protein